MANVLPLEYEKVYQLNENLLTLAKESKWDEFIELAEMYVTAVSDVLAKQPADMMEKEKENFASLLQCLVNNEVEIKKTLQKRLDFLKKDMSSLHIGKKCSEAYTRQYIAAFH
ncbi:flagellar protein FliT [Scandinavium sp.]|uniref:flagellar protein FliT n=1 Tax=Scandinavium sp. TaxID=2830653 RepID=UPI00289FDD32|nr:flagellar protein FliT [Scandinavium sp.]